MQVEAKRQLPSLSFLSDHDPDRKTVSLPLEFQFLPVDILSKQFTKLNNNHSYRIHYLGPRPHNTLALHKKYSASQKTKQQYTAMTKNQSWERYSIDMRRIVQSHILQQKLRGNSYYRSGLFYRAFEGMNPYLGEGQWLFNSLFEGGNLDCVIKINQSEFDLFLRVDANTKGHVQWFYFSIKNGPRKQKIKLNICNLSKGKSLYNANMQPYVFSKQQNLSNGTGWKQDGNNLGINFKTLRYDHLNQLLPSHLLNFYCLELQYTFSHQNDQVFFAYCVPYNFSRLLKDISSLDQKWVKRGILGKSLSGIDIPLLHITNHQLQKQKKNVLITGRWHPAESNSSHMLKGFMDFLTSSSKDATQLRNRLNFFIVPMANPDGVVIGNNRTSMAGKDLNRQFIIANKQFYPEVALVKDLARKLQSSFGLFMYLDFHGHSRKKNTFFYGPAYMIHEPNYYKSRIYPKLVQKVDSNFRFHSCSFTIDEQKKQTARAVIFQQIKVPFTFTIETSIGSYYNSEQMKTLPFNETQWNKIGASIGQGLSKFIVGFEEYEELIRQRRCSRQKKRPPTAGKHAFTQQTNQEDQITSYFKRGQPLKIGYSQNSLFGTVIDEIKNIKNTQAYIKEIDEDCQSDTHDQKEEFQASKMKEFNSLLTDAAKRDQPKNQKKDNSFSVRSHRPAQHLLVDAELLAAQEMMFLEELDEVKKVSTVLPPKEVPKPVLPQASKTTNQWRKNQNNTIRNQSQFQHRDSPTKIEKASVRRSFDKKIVSETELPSQKISYFGEFRIFVDETKAQEKTKQFHRNSIFTREKCKSSKRSALQNQMKFMSETLLQRPDRTTYSQYMPMAMPMPLPPPRSNNFQFKFDEIETAMVAKSQKLKDYLRTKINRSSRSSTIGPASFYGLRQNINQKKINNKQRFVSKDQGEKRRDSIKIIKFV